MPDVALLTLLEDIARARMLEDVPLDMSTFWHPCGTFGCLAGWAAQDPRFAAMGLSLEPGTYGGRTSTGNRQGCLLLHRKRNGEPYMLTNFDALASLFDLDDYQVAYLFGDNDPNVTGYERIIDWMDCLERIGEVRRGEV
jgi:hypothetical protein